MKHDENDEYATKKPAALLHIEQNSLELVAGNPAFDATIDTTDFHRQTQYPKNAVSHFGPSCPQRFCPPTSPHTFVDGLFTRILENC